MENVALYFLMESFALGLFAVGPGCKFQTRKERNMQVHSNTEGSSLEALISSYVESVKALTGACHSSYVETDPKYEHRTDERLERGIKRVEESIENDTEDFLEAIHYNSDILCKLNTERTRRQTNIQTAS